MLGHLLLAWQTFLEQLSQDAFDPLFQRSVLQCGHQPLGMFFQGAQQLRIGLAQWQLQIRQWDNQRRIRLVEQYRAVEELLVLCQRRVGRTGMFQPDGGRRHLRVGDPARVLQPGTEHVFHQVSANSRALMAACPDQVHLAALHLGAADAHVSHQFLERHDAAHRIAQRRAVHGDVTQHAPGVGQHKTRGVETEQRIARVFAEIVEQPFMGFTWQPQAVVTQLLCLQPGSRQRRLDGHAQLFGMTQVFEQRRN
ncbi:hypothetical protein D3C76_980090 [compost metagenome]